MPRTALQDPYRKFRFVIKFNGAAVAGMTKMSALTVNVEATDHRLSDDEAINRKLPGLVSYEPITLDRGVTNDTTFQDWATTMANYVGASGADSEKADEFRKNITIEVKDFQGNIVKTYEVKECWVSKYTALPDLDSSSSEVLIETIELQNEGWSIV